MFIFGQLKPDAGDLAFQRKYSPDKGTESLYMWGRFEASLVT